MRLDCLSGAAVSQLPVLCDHAIDQSLREKAEWAALRYGPRARSSRLVQHRCDLHSLDGASGCIEAYKSSRIGMILEPIGTIW